MDDGGTTAQPRTGNGKPGASESASLDIFISYSRKDALPFAKQLAKALEALGHTPVMDLAGISAGEDFEERLGQMILGADVMVFILSPEALQSKVCEWEVAEATRLKKRIFPIKPDALPGIAIPEALRKRQWIHFYADPDVPDSGFGHGIEELSRVLRADIKWVREHRRLLTQASDWVREDKNPDRLFRGTLLEKTDAWLAAKPPSAPDLTPVMRAFLDACRQAEEADKAEAKKQLEEKQAAQDAREQALKDAQAALEQAKKEQAAREVAQKEAVAASKKAKQQAQRVTLVTVAGLLLAMALAGLAAWQLWANMELTMTTQRTESGLLANASSQFTEWPLGRDAGTALLLALEGLPDEASPDETKQLRAWEPKARVELGRALNNIQERLVIEGHEALVWSAAFSPDGTRIFTASEDNTARVWDAATGSELLRLEGHGGPVLSAAFSPDGSRIVTASDDKTARLWDAATGAEVARLEGHGSSVQSAAYSPDGRRIVTASSDKTARVWDAATGSELRRLEGHEDRVWSAAFSPDGASIITASQGRTARLWRVYGPVQELVDPAKARAPRCLTQSQRKEYFLPLAPPVWCITGAGNERETDPGKWKPLWPYRTDDWKQWLIATRAGGSPELPKDATQK